MAAPREKTILIVDDSEDTLEILERNLQARGFTVWKATSVSGAVLHLKTRPFDLVITDLKMPCAGGLDLVRHVRENYRDAEVMMITGYASIEGAVEALKTGAEEYLAKPFTEEELISAVERALGKLEVRRVSCPHRQELPAPSFHGLLGESPGMHEVQRMISKAAQASANVLITGESGTGKELVARAIHYASRRASFPFVVVNCGAIPEGLMESELFGHVKGAFTGATESRAGFFQTADGGTIFLDEIGNTTVSMQARLLRVLQDKEVCMVGSSKSRRVDVRIVAATNKDLQSLIGKDLFRHDLFYRINVISLCLPPLRDRENDSILLARRFAEKYSREMGREAPRFTGRAMEVIRRYSWPGNVRELENVIQQILVLSDEVLIDAPDLPSFMRYTASMDEGVERSLRDVEESHIERVMEHVKGNKTRAAALLGIDRKTLRDKLAQMGEREKKKT